MPRILRLIPAKRDLIDHFVFIGQAIDTEAAQRFLDSADKTLEQLAKMPRMGIKRQFRSQKFGDVRVWRVKGFEKISHLLPPDYQWHRGTSSPPRRARHRNSFRVIIHRDHPPSLQAPA